MAKPISALDDEALAWLVKLNSGHLSLSEEQAFFAWLHSSTAHQAAYLRVEELWEQSAVIATAADIATAPVEGATATPPPTGRKKQAHPYKAHPNCCLATGPLPLAL